MPIVFSFPDCVPAGSDLLRHLAAVHDPHDSVSEVGGRPEHQRTAAIDHGDAMLPAVVGGGDRHAARAGAPMHPHVLDSQLGTLAHGLVRKLGPGSDHYGLYATRDRLQVLIGHVSLDLTGVRVDCEHVV